LGPILIYQTVSRETVWKVRISLTLGSYE
jgi:hypothetical protein